MASWTHHRARIAALSRDRKPDDPDLLDARRDLRAARLSDYIEKTVAEAPPLTDDQRDRLAALLRPVRIKAVDLIERERHADSANLDTRPAGGAA